MTHNEFCPLWVFRKQDLFNSYRIHLQALASWQLRCQSSNVGSLGDPGLVLMLRIWLVEEGQKVGNVGFLWLVIGEEGSVSRGCWRAATKKGKTGNDIIPEPEGITMTTEMTPYRNRKWKIIIATSHLSGKNKFFNQPILSLQVGACAWNRVVSGVL